MQFSQTSNGLSQTSYSLCMQMAVTGMQNSDFFFPFMETSLHIIIANNDKCCFGSSHGRLFENVFNKTGPWATSCLLSAVLALFTLPYFSHKGLSDFSDQKTCHNQINPLHGQV